MLGSSSIKPNVLSVVNKLKMTVAVRFKCGNKASKIMCRGVFNKSPCGKPENKAKPKTKVNEKKISKSPSMWLNPFCDEDEIHCPFNPRFDDIYYTESDKAKRKYWQTWVSCPPTKIKKKQICCFDNVMAAPQRRRKHYRPKTACPVKVQCREDEDECPRVKRRCHRAGRIPPHCEPLRRPLDCKKPLTPYPAFSECLRRAPNALPLSECVCWSKPMICEVWAEWRRRSAAQKRRVG